MDSTTTERKVPFQETYARQKLARLADCKARGIKPAQTDDGTVCLNDQVRLVGNPLRHDADELRARSMAGEWP